MTERAARRALTAIAALLALVVTVLLGGRPEPDTPNQEPAATTPQVVAAAADHMRSARRTPAEPTEDPHGHDTPAGASDRHEARLSARTFVAALLRYQAGAGRQRWRQEVEKSAAQSLARRLTRRPPRQVQATAPLGGNVRSLEVHGPLRGRIRASAIVTYGDGLRSLIDLELRRRAGRWRVTSLYR